LISYVTGLAFIANSFAEAMTLIRFRKQRRNTMKMFAKSLLFAGVLMMGVNGLMGASADPANMSLKQLVKETKTLEATAETPMQHKMLAIEYRQLAVRQHGESNKHAEQAAWYAQYPIYLSAKFRSSTIDHCKYLAEKYRKEAQRSEEMAAHHEGLAS
jgi:hypothetical protein